MWKTNSLKVLVCMTFIILSGCDSDQSNAVKKINTMKVIDIQPPLSKTLTPGQKAITKVKVAYELKSKAAVITLAVLRPRKFGSKSLASSFGIVQQGKNELELGLEFIVPNNLDSIDVQVLLTPQQRNDSAPATKLTYKIGR